MKYKIQFELNSKQMEMLIETEYLLKGKIKVLKLTGIKENNPFDGDLLSFLKGFKK